MMELCSVRLFALLPVASIPGKPSRLSILNDRCLSVSRTSYLLLLLTTLIWIQSEFGLETLSATTPDPVLYEDFCETESFNASCDSTNDVILMTHARYGRMRLSRCAKIDYGHIGCAADVLELADSRCSGRRACEITIPDALFAKSQPCPEDLKPYLEVGYTCIPVETPSASCPFPGSLPISATISQPTSSSSPSGGSSPSPASFSVFSSRSSRSSSPISGFADHLSSSSSGGSSSSSPSSVAGYLANVVTETTGCGGLTSPWAIETDPGRRIRLTLFDFHVARARPTSYVRPRCPLYAVLREQLPSGGQRKMTVCGGGAEREKVVYTSATSRLEVGIAHSDDVSSSSGPYFMFKYEVIGCPDVVPVYGAVAVRNGDQLTVKCNHSRDEFHLRCVDLQWVGIIHNCTTVSSLSTAAEKVNRHNQHNIAHGNSNINDVTISYGSSIIIVLITALAIGLLVLSAGLIILTRHKATRGGRRRRRKSGKRSSLQRLRDYDKELIVAGSGGGGGGGAGGLGSTRLLYDTQRMSTLSHDAPLGDISTSGSPLYVDSSADYASGGCQTSSLLHHQHRSGASQQQQQHYYICRSSLGQDSLLFADPYVCTGLESVSGGGLAAPRLSVDGGPPPGYSESPYGRCHVQQPPPEMEMIADFGACRHRCDRKPDVAASCASASTGSSDSRSPVVTTSSSAAAGDVSTPVKVAPQTDG